MTTRAPFRGTTLAGALLFDVPTIGTSEARRRALEHWQPDSTLRALADGRWLLTLPEPLTIRAEYAPGLPLVRQGGGWSAAGLPSEAEAVTFPLAGEVVTIAVTQTRPVDTDGWVDLSGLVVHRLEPLDRPPAVAEVPRQVAVTPHPDLRAGAGVGAPSHTFDSFRRSLERRKRPTAVSTAEPGTVPLWWVVAGFGVAVAFVVVLIVVAGDSSRLLIQVVSNILAVTVVLIIVWKSTTTSGGVPGEPSASRGQPRGPGAVRQLWASLVRASPAGYFVSRAQRRYLEQLARRFEQGEYDQALRDAIGFRGGALDSLMSLRLPRPRTSIAPGSTPRGGSNSFGGDLTAFAQLKELYLGAARRLEKTGRIKEAAFVYADLLDDDRAAVTLLERHQQPRLAAELAESQLLEAALVVRLWWRAGDRDRAIEVARSRGAFTAGIERLHAVDPGQARELRLAWVQYCRDAGDPVGAVEAGWPDATLRSAVLQDIAIGMAMGGPQAAYLFAHLVTERPTARNLDNALALLDSDAVDARQRFISALVRLRSTDRAHDKRLATAALRSLLRDGSNDDPAVRRALAVLRDRCDPLVRADLPRLPSRPAGRGAALTFGLADTPGALPVADAVAMRGGAVLVAHGDHGVRLLTHDGRTRARWDLPVQALIVADHGGTALLVTSSESAKTIHRLDLATRTVRPWTTLPAWYLFPSYDGGLLTVIDEDGLAFVDTLAEHPKTLWRELDAAHGILVVNRTPGRLTALATNVPADPTQQAQLQLLSWELPSMTLRLRRRLEPDLLNEQLVVLPEQLVVATDQVISIRKHEPPQARELPTGRLISNGAVLGLLDEDQLSVEVEGRLVATVGCPSFPFLRQHDGLVTVWTPDGRIAVIDPAQPSALANFRTRL